MRKHYDFSRPDETCTPGGSRSRSRSGINMYLRDCAESRKELRLEWRPADDAS
jgi:hypothetical protein